MRKLLQAMILMTVTTTSSFGLSISDIANKIDINKYIPKVQKQESKQQKHKPHTNVSHRTSKAHVKVIFHNLRALGFAGLDNIYETLAHGGKLKTDYAYSAVMYSCVNCHYNISIHNYIRKEYTSKIKKARQQMLDKYGYVDETKLPKMDEVLSCDVYKNILKYKNPFLAQPFPIYFLYYTITKDAEEYSEMIAKAVSTKCFKAAIHGYNMRHKDKPANFDKAMMKSLQNALYQSAKFMAQTIATTKPPYGGMYGLTAGLYGPISAMNFINRAIPAEFKPKLSRDEKSHLRHIKFRNAFHAYNWFFDNYIRRMSKDEFMEKWITYWKHQDRGMFREDYYKKCAQPYMIKYGAAIYEMIHMN